jgi:hypothetical protein
MCRMLPDEGAVRRNADVSLRNAGGASSQLPADVAGKLSVDSANHANTRTSNRRIYAYYGSR